MLLFIWFIAITTGLAVLGRALLIVSDETEFYVSRGSVVFGMLYRIVVMCVAIALIMEASQ